MDQAGTIFRIQIKCTTSRKGRAELSLEKKTLNPKYNYSYTRNDVDVYALYIEDRDIVVFVPSSLVFLNKEQRKSFTFRLDPPKNNQVKGCNTVDQFLKFPH